MYTLADHQVRSDPTDAVQHNSSAVTPEGAAGLSYYTAEVDLV